MVLLTLYRNSLLILGVIGIAGCATVEDKPGITDVQAMTQSRGIQTIQWNRATDTDSQVQTAIRTMLEDGLTVEEAIQIALLNNRDLRSTYESLRISQAELVQAGMPKNPVIDGSVRFVSSGGGQILDLGIATDFLDILFIPVRKRLAEQEFEKTKRQVAGQVLDLATRVRTTFYKLQAAKQILEIQKKFLLSYEAAYDLSRRLRAAGNITLSQTARDQAALEETKLALNTLETEVIGFKEELNVLMGLYGSSTVWETEQTLPELPGVTFDPQALVSQALQQSLDLQIARRNIETAAIRLGITQPMGILSELEVGATAEREADGLWSVGPTLAVPIPIISQGQPVLAKAESELHQALNTYYSTAVRIRAVVRTLYAQLQAARSRTTHLQEVILPLKQLIVEESQKQFNAMQLSAFDLLQAKNDELLTQLQQVQALRDYWIAYSRLQLALSGRLVQTEQTSTNSFTTPTSTTNGGH
ncbi:MAG: copper resistance-related lipoprotein [Phycisphaerae bacterium]|nr:MAG: copper resistance-related lipoprotein [Phycisphaerae bacterium]